MSASGVLFSDMVPSNTTYAEIVDTISDSGAVNNNSKNWINMLLDCNPVRQNLTIIIIIILFSRYVLLVYSVPISYSDTTSVANKRIQNKIQN